MAKLMDTSSIKLAVTYEGSSEAFLGGFNIQDQLSDLIAVLCKRWNLANPENYGLQFAVNNLPKHYVTDYNKDKIKDGHIFVLVSSATRFTENIVKRIQNGGKSECADALQNLAKFSSDPAVTGEFIRMQGMQVIIDGIENDRFDMKSLPNALHSFLEMSHSIGSWDALSPAFISQIVSFINHQSSMEFFVLQTSLDILESVVINSQINYGHVEGMITLPNLIHHISNCRVSKGNKGKDAESEQEERKREKFQQSLFASILGFINALFQRAETPQKRKYFFSVLTSRQYRNIIKDNIFPSIESGNLMPVLQHQLYVLQQLLLNHYEDKMMTPLDPTDPKAIEDLAKLQNVMFEDTREVISKDVMTRRMEIKKEYKNLGFKDDVNPANDFMETPPGVLALDNMIHFAIARSDQYSKLVLENCYRADSHECPFGRASIELTKLLCDILKVGESPHEEGMLFYPMLFTHDHAFEELFCICIVLFNKTWKEMKATTEDFSKVVCVVKDQINRTMRDLPPTLDRFNENINRLTYSDIAEIWQKERLNHEQKEMQAPAILELKKQIRPDINELIQQHRLNFLVNGSIFRHHKARGGKDKHWYCRLSQNHKFLHYGDCDEKATPSVDDLKDKISISDINDIIVNPHPHKKEKANKKYSEAFVFSLSYNDKTLDLLTSDESTFHYWIDGINVLLRRRMSSRAMEHELELLLNMELKLRLLDIEGVPIPENPPPIPPPPPNYNFFYQSA